MQSHDLTHPGGPPAAMPPDVARAVQEVQAQVIVARANPRSPEQTRQALLAECTSKGLAAVSEFKFKRGTGDVTGPTIHLLEAAARAWGNINYGWDVVAELDGATKIRVYAWDMQANSRISREVVVPHWVAKKNGAKRMLTDPRDIYENNANIAARRLRACLEQLIPGYLIEEAVNACRATLGQSPTKVRRGDEDVEDVEDDTTPPGFKELSQALLASADADAAQKTWTMILDAWKQNRITNAEMDELTTLKEQVKAKLAPRPTPPEADLVTVRFSVFEADMVQKGYQVQAAVSGSWKKHRTEWTAGLTPHQAHDLTSRVTGWILTLPQSIAPAPGDGADIPVISDAEFYQQAAIDLYRQGLELSAAGGDPDAVLVYWEKHEHEMNVALGTDQMHEIEQLYNRLVNKLLNLSEETHANP